MADFEFKALRDRFEAERKYYTDIERENDAFAKRQLARIQRQIAQAREWQNFNTVFGAEFVATFGNMKAAEEIYYNTSATLRQAHIAAVAGEMAFQVLAAKSLAEGFTTLLKGLLGYLEKKAEVKMIEQIAEALGSWPDGAAMAHHFAGCRHVGNAHRRVGRSQLRRVGGRRYTRGSGRGRYRARARRGRRAACRWRGQYHRSQTGGARSRHGQRGRPATVGACDGARDG